MDPDDLMQVLDRPRAARVLRYLARNEPINQRALTEVSRHSPEQAKQLREALEQAGLVKVRELSGHGNAGIKEIRLTPLGRQVADHFAAIEDVVRRQATVRVRGRE